MEHQDQEFLEFVVKAIVNHPEDVSSERTVDERGVLITLSLNPTDMGYVIGRRGQTARSIRSLLKVVGAKNNARVNLKINEPEGSEHRRRPRYEDRDDNAQQSAPLDSGDPAIASIPDEDPKDKKREDIDMSAVDLNI